jgi:hypothetical protein
MDHPGSVGPGRSQTEETNPLVYAQEYLAEFVDWSGVAFFSREKLLADNLPLPVLELGGQEPRQFLLQHLHGPSVRIS